MDTKICRKCGETQPVEAFYVDRSRKDGRCTQCRACQRAGLPHALCAGDCGGIVLIVAGSLPAGRAMCHPCRAARRGTPSVRRDRSPDEETLSCSVCGQVFPFARTKDATQTPRKLCDSMDCRREHARRVGRATAASRAIAVRKPHPCPDCGATVVGPHNAHCEECSRALYLERNRRTNTRRRGARPRKRRMTTLQLGNRDGWRCHLCRRKVDRNVKWPHPMSPSQDHLIPVADGGDDEPENIALAHLRCNTVRGTGGVVQLALVG